MTAPESNTFNYVEYDSETVKAQKLFKESYESLERMLMLLAPSRPRSLALTELEVSYMWVGKALRDDQIARQTNKPGTL